MSIDIIWAIFENDLSSSSSLVLIVRICIFQIKSHIIIETKTKLKAGEPSRHRSHGYEINSRAKLAEVIQLKHWLQHWRDHRGKDTCLL